MLSNIGALTIPEVPKHLIVIGGGVIGLELGSVWRRLGAKVTVVELLPTILPGNDEEIIKEADKIFRKQGLEIRAGTKVDGREASTANRVVVDVEKDGKSETLEADYVLVSVGRKPSLNGIDAAALGLDAGQARRDRSSTRRCGPIFRTSTRSAMQSAGSSSRTRRRKKESSRPR